MKVIKIIGLVNNVYNDFHIPNKIKYKNEIYLWNEEYQWFVTLDNTTLFRIDKNKLNDEVEVIEEEKEIEELEELDLKYDIENNDIYNFKRQILMYCDNLQYKINELVREVNKLKKEVNR